MPVTPARAERVVANTIVLWIDPVTSVSNGCPFCFQVFPWFASLGSRVQIEVCFM